MKSNVSFIAFKRSHLNKSDMDVLVSFITSSVHENIRPQHQIRIARLLFLDVVHNPFSGTPTSEMDSFGGVRTWTIYNKKRRVSFTFLRFFGLNCEQLNITVTFWFFFLLLYQMELWGASL